MSGLATQCGLSGCGERITRIRKNGRVGERERDGQVREDNRDMERDRDGHECERTWLGVMWCEGQCIGDVNGCHCQQRAGRNRLVKKKTPASLCETSGGSLGGEFWAIGGNAGYRHSALMEERKEEEQEV